MSFPRFTTGFRKISNTLLQLCFPGLCVLCGRELLGEVNDAIALCLTCRRSFQPLCEGPRCRVCNRLLLAEREICLYCRERSYHFEQHKSLFPYAGRIKELLYQYKSAYARGLAPFLAGLFGFLPGENFSAKLLVPVPGNPAARRRRGWDHMELIAANLAATRHCAWLICLGRKAGSPQKELGFQARSENLVNKIYLKKDRGLSGRDIVLLDDIFTTGATLSECARILKSVGARRVEAVTLAQD